MAKRRSELATLEIDLEQVSRNLARAKSDQQYQAIAKEFDRLSRQVDETKAAVADLEKKAITQNDPEAEIEAAIQCVEQLTTLVDNAEDHEIDTRLFDLVDAKIFASLEQVKPKKRFINRVAGGVLTISNQQPPIEIYKGSTARQKIKKNKTPTCKKDKSLGNVSRGDWI